MKLSPSIFKAYDIRGIYQKEIDEEGIVPLTRAIYEFFLRDIGKDSLTIVLGRDMRISSPSFFEAAKKTLVECGATVIDIGLSPTPTFYYAVTKYGYDAGIDITASHNPKEYGGMKFVKRDGDKIIKIGRDAGMDKIKEMALKNDFPEPKGGGKVIEKHDVLDDEVNDALAEFDVSKLKKFRIACDPANGMGSLYVKKLFKKIPGELVIINGELDGTFPNHQADPLDFNNLVPLQEKVKEIGANLGIEPDGDGDRIFFINEKAEVIPATLTSSLIAKEVLEKHPGETMIVDVRYTRNFSNIVNKNGKTYVSKVGHAFITADVNREKAFFAGESSGHFYFGKTGGAESAVRVILYVLTAMSETGKPISEILHELQSSYESGELNFVLPDGTDSKELMKAIAAEHGDADVSWLDGVAVDYPDWRFSIRSSNTEPLLRLNVEANAPELMKEKFEALTKRITSIGASIKQPGH